MSVKPWKLISKEEVFRKFGRGINRVVFELPSKKQDEFYLKTEGPTVSILAITKANKVILLEQFRPGPNKVLIELPGGFASHDNPLEQARKELLEETGYAGDLELVTGLWDDAYSTMYRYVFVAKNCKKVSGLNLEENEFVNPILVSLAKFRKIIRSGEMTDIECAYLGLDFLRILC